MEWNLMWEKTKKMRTSRPSSIVQIMTDHRQLKNVEYFNYFNSMIINDTRSTCEIKSRTAIEKVTFNKKTFHQQIGLRFKEETIEALHLAHNTVWC